MFQTVGGWLVPLAALGGVVVLAGVAWVASSRRGAATDETDDALEALKRRYVAGEIDEATYERRLEALFETETVADARAYAERVTPDRDDTGAPAATPAPEPRRAGGSRARRSGDRGAGRAGQSSGCGTDRGGQSGGCGGGRSHRSRRDPDSRRGC